MKYKAKSLTLLSSIMLSSIALTGCGGGSDGENNDSDPKKANDTVSISAPSTVIEGSSSFMEYIISVPANSAAFGFNAQAASVATTINNVLLPDLSAQDASMAIVNNDDADACWNDNAPVGEQGAVLNAGESCTLDVELNAGAVDSGNTKDINADITVTTNANTLSLPVRTTVVDENSSELAALLTQINSASSVARPDNWLVIELKNNTGSSLNRPRLDLSALSDGFYQADISDIIYNGELADGQSIRFQVALNGNIATDGALKTEFEKLGNNPTNKLISVKVANGKTLYPTLSIKSTPIDLSLPNSLVFDSTNLDYSFSFNNTSHSALTIKKINLPQGFETSESYDGTTVQAGASLLVLFTASAAAQSGVMTVDYSDGENDFTSQASTINVDNTLSVEDISISGSNTLFIATDGSSKKYSFTLTNKGSFNLNLPEIGGFISSKAGVSVDSASNCLNQTLAPEESCSLTLNVASTTVAGSGSITVASANISIPYTLVLSDPDNAVSLNSVNKLPATMILDANPLYLKLNFAVSPDATSSQNNLAIALPSGMTQVNTDASNSCKSGASINAGGSCTLEIEYQPDDLGEKTKTISIVDETSAQVDYSFNIEVVDASDTRNQSLTLSQQVFLFPGATSKIAIKNNSATEVVNNVKLKLAPWLADISQPNGVTTLNSLSPGQSYTFSIIIDDTTEAVDAIEQNHTALGNNDENGEVISIGSANFKTLMPAISFEDDSLVIASTVFRQPGRNTVQVQNQGTDSLSINGVTIKATATNAVLNGVTYAGADTVSVASGQSVALPFDVLTTANGQGKIEIAYSLNSGLSSKADKLLTVDNSLNADDITITPGAVIASDTELGFITYTNNGDFAWYSSNDSEDFFSSLPEGVSFDQLNSTCGDGVVVEPGDSCQLAFNIPLSAEGQSLTVYAAAVNNLKTGVSSTKIPISLQPVVFKTGEFSMPDEMLAGQTAWVDLKLENASDESVQIESLTNTDVIKLAHVEGGQCDIDISEAKGTLGANSSCVLRFDISPIEADGQVFNGQIDAVIKLGDENGFTLSYPLTSSLKSSITGIQTVIVTTTNFSDYILRGGSRFEIDLAPSTKINHAHFVIGDDYQELLNYVSFPVIDKKGRNKYTIGVEASAAAEAYLKSIKDDLLDNVNKKVIGIAAANSNAYYENDWDTSATLVTSPQLISQPGGFDYKPDLSGSVIFKGIDTTKLPHGVSLDAANSPAEDSAIDNSAVFRFNVDVDAYSSGDLQGISLNLVDNNAQAYGANFIEFDVAGVSVSTADNGVISINGEDDVAVSVKNTGRFNWQPSNNTNDYGIVDPFGNTLDSMTVLANTGENSCLDGNSVSPGAYCNLWFKGDQIMLEGSYSLSFKASSQNNLSRSQNTQVLMMSDSATEASAVVNEAQHIGVKSIEIINPSSLAIDIAVSLSDASAFEIYTGSNGDDGDIGPWCDADGCPNSLYANGQAAMTIPAASSRKIYVRAKEGLALGEKKTASLTIHSDSGNLDSRFTLNAKGWYYLSGNFSPTFAPDAKANAFTRFDGEGFSAASSVGLSSEYPVYIAKTATNDVIASSQHGVFGDSKRYAYFNGGSFNQIGDETYYPKQGDSRFYLDRQGRLYGEIGNGAGVEGMENMAHNFRWNGAFFTSIGVNEQYAYQIYMKPVLHNNNLQGNYYYFTYSGSKIPGGPLYGNSLAIYNAADNSWQAFDEYFSYPPSEINYDKDGNTYFSGAFGSSTILDEAYIVAMDKNGDFFSTGYDSDHYRSLYKTLYNAIDNSLYGFAWDVNAETNAARHGERNARSSRPG
ncbi:MAG: hypothetical protein ACO2ZM_07320 [Francisellaceae bacterium]